MHALTVTERFVIAMQPLFEYISGANQEGVNINMTAPVLVKIAAGAGPFCTSNFTVSFYVPTAQVSL